MPWKFLIFLVILAIVIVFAGINVNNSADIDLGFHRFESVPVFVGLGSAYVLGAVSILPFALNKAFRKRRKLSNRYKEKQRVAEHGVSTVSPAETPSTEGDAEAPDGTKKKGRRVRRKRS